MTRLPRLLSSTFVVVALAFAGCGDDGSPAGADAGPADGAASGIPLDQTPAMLAGVYCEQFEACLGAFAELFFGAGDCTELFTRIIEDTTLPGWQAAVEGGSTNYHAELMADCIGEFRDAGCDLFYQRLPESCQEALQGTISIGSDCFEDVSCEADAFCDFSGSCLTGTCAAPRPAGAPCATDEGCVSGTECAREICTAPARDGESCQGGTAPNCATGLLCVGSDDTSGTPGACRTIASITAAGEGATCDLDAGVFCQAGLFCVVTGTGQVCVSESPGFGRCFLGFPDPCPEGQFCNATMGGEEGDCTALPVSGSACRTSSFPRADCAAGATCISDICIPMERLGGSCSVDAQCYSDNCDLMSCMLPNRCL